MDVDDLLAKVLVGAGTGLFVRILTASVGHSRRIIKKLIKEAQQKQQLHPSEMWGSYADIEEVLGDFLEKYRTYIRRTPSFSRWEFFCKVAPDILGLMKALLWMTVNRLLGSDETPRA